MGPGVGSEEPGDTVERRSRRGAGSSVRRRGRPVARAGRRDAGVWVHRGPREARRTQPWSLGEGRGAPTGRRSGSSREARQAKGLSERILAQDTPGSGEEDFFVKVPLRRF